ncbi:hypothetical protein BKA70DRAFT_24867 [Coprinopsis sp. MPI-PUGE-AT-0042]|nr:hypothetical protein BKA70DRAFT_24867 [Coprinopsis sp. MPI-PUGE-AT-0042]
MMALHDWSVFRRFRAGIFGFASFIAISIAVMSIVKLVNGWTVFHSHQRTALSFLLCVNVVSSISLVLMLFLPFRPVADLLRAGIIFVFQIGLTAVYTLAIPNLPCVQSDVVQSCKTLNSLIFAGTGIFCCLLFVYLVGLTPKLKQPYIARPSPYQHQDFKGPLDRESISASTLTYASWDRIPEKAGDGVLPPYSSNGFVDTYYYKLQSKTPSPPRPRPPSISKSPMMMPNPFMTPQSGFAELGRDDSSDSLRPFTPMLPDSHARSKSRLRGSASSFASLSSRKSSDSDLEELKRAVIAPQTVPYAELVRRGSGESSLLSLPKGAQAPHRPLAEDILPPPFITLTDTDLMESRKSIAFSRAKDDVSIIPHKVKRKAPPQQLSLGNHLEFLNDGGFSAVPRSPSPISPGVGSTLPAVPNSGALPSHPRLTMHFREMRLAHDQSATSTQNVRNLTP